MRQIVRIINADILGNKQVYSGLRKISGISYGFSNAVCSVMSFDKSKKIGELTDVEVKKIEDIIKNPEKFGIPNYLLNRRKDYDTGEDKHIITADLKLTTEFDVKRMKKTKSYRGLRHQWGLPVRGQRTKAHFRKGAAVGVKKKALVGKKS